MRGTVVLSRSGFFDVRADGELYRCRLRGRLKKTRRATDLCVVGDEVDLVLGLEPGDDGIIERVLPRRSVFSRKTPGKAGRWREDVMVANLDLLLAVFAYGAPPFHRRMLDRFLVVAAHNGVEAVVVANKVDRADEETRAVFDEYAAIGYRVAHVSATTGEGVGALRAALAGRVAALTGPSGVGKSSLANALQPGLDLAVAETAAHGKGRHCTRAAELHRLDGGGAIVDTPGIRELGTWRIPPEEVAGCFPDIAPFLGACAFGDCSHVHEPGCRVLEALDDGEIGEERYDSYLRLLDPD